MIPQKYITRGAYHVAWYNNKQNEWYPKLVDEVVSFCQGDTLDIGGGEGLPASLIVANGHSVTVVDADPIAVAMGKQLFPTLRFLEKDIVKSRMKGKWEYMVCLNAIEHLQSPEVLLEVIEKNVTRAAIIITDKADPSRELGQGHVKEYTLDELVDLFKDFKPEPFEIGGDFIGVKIRVSNPN